MQMNRNSNNQELPDGGKRYLAGEDNTIDYDSIDTMVAARNSDAYEVTKVHIVYDYIEDGDNNYKWGANVEDIHTKATNPSEDGRPDIFVNFVYDMVGTSLKGSFANVYGNNVGQGQNYFTFSAAPNAEDTGDGYMYEYMRSLTLSKKKMYCLASDYFLDTIRAFFVVPVNVKLMNSIEVDYASVGADENYDYKYNSDRTGDGDFTIDDFYELINAGEWNYATMLEYSNAVKREGGGQGNDSSTYDLRDTVGFALGINGLPASGMLYTTSIKIINRDYVEYDDKGKEVFDFVYSYPETNPELYDFCEALSDLVDNSKGVIVVGEQDLYGYDLGTGKPLIAIRERFKEGGILFGGVILIGSLEYQTYQDMNKEGGAGFGVAPVPLYRAINPATGEPDPYQTQIHNVGRIGGIAVKSQKFEMASAFLQYQSTHSTEILNEYYDYKLQYEIAGGSSGNIAMLKYIRENVRSSFDKAFEDAIGVFFESVDEEAKDNRWHELIVMAGYKYDNFAETYKSLIGTKIKNLQGLYNEYDKLP
jgi:hypothetical protein